MKSKRFNIFILLGLLFITAALCLAGYNVWKDMNAGIQSVNVMEQLDIGESSSNGTGLSKLPVCTVEGVSYIGVIEIPELGMQLPVASFWDEDAAATVPCRYVGSPYTGDLIIAGHNYRSQFGKLRNLYPGAEICFTDMDGNSFVYSVVSMETIDGFDITGMKEGSGTDLLENSVEMDCWDLTLFTCNFSGQARLAVRCVGN